MKNLWYKSNEAKQLYIGLAILFAWSLITGIYSYIKDIDWLSTMKMFWTTLNCNIGLGWLIIIFIIYSFALKLYFSKMLNRNYLTKQEVNKRLSEKVNCSCCDESWDILFSQITPYHPLHDLNTDKSYYINRFKYMISSGLSRKPSPDYYKIEYGIDGLTNVLSECKYLSDLERDSIMFYLNQCSDKEVRSKKERLIKLIEQTQK